MPEVIKARESHRVEEKPTPTLPVDLLRATRECGNTEQ